MSGGREEQVAAKKPRGREKELGSGVGANQEEIALADDTESSRIRGGRERKSAQGERKRQPFQPEKPVRRNDFRSSEQPVDRV